MTSRITRAALPVVVASALTTLATSAPAQDKPNIVIIMTDKELYNLVGRSGGTPMYVPLMRAAAPYLASFQEYPNGDYSMMTRDR